MAVVFPGDFFFCAQARFGDFLARRATGYPAQVKFRNAGSISGSEDRANVPKAPYIFQYYSRKPFVELLLGLFSGSF
jgi:hypothetical protein